MWGALLRGLSYAPIVGKGVIDFIKRHKTGTVIVGLPTVGGAYSLLQPDKKPDEVNQQQAQQPAQQSGQQPAQQSGQQQAQQPQQAAPQQGGKQKTANQQPTKQSSVKVGNKTSNYSPSENSDNESLSQITKQMQSLFLDLEKNRQMYDTLSQQYLQANEIYEKQLLQTMQVVPLLLAKTPLNSMTNEDLIQHMNQLFTSMPYGDALNKVSDITKGYYFAKMNGVDPSTLSTTDLAMIAENPVLAKSVNENLAQFLEQMGEILKYKIKSNMDKVGALKDQYQNMLKELEEKGKIYKWIIDARKFEIKQEFDWDKFLRKLGYDFEKLNQQKYYQDKRLEIEERKQEAKEQKEKEKGEGEGANIGGSLKSGNKNQ